MVERFWWGLVGGTYVGHSETYAADRNPDYSWLGQGGRLQGSSAPRLAFLKRIMEEGPVPGIDQPVVDRGVEWAAALGEWMARLSARIGERLAEDRKSTRLNSSH